MGKRKYYKTVLRVVILSETKNITDNMDLYEIANEIDTGDCSGEVKTIEQSEVTPQVMAGLLEDQGSDPEFFRLDSDGNELD